MIPSTSSHSLTGDMTEIQCPDRWMVYQRLRELDIPCHCKAYQPLWATVDTVSAATQIWSVVFRISGSRSQQRQWLERCWQLKTL